MSIGNMKITIPDLAQIRARLHSGDVDGALELCSHLVELVDLLRRPPPAVNGVVVDTEALRTRLAAGPPLPWKASNCNDPGHAERAPMACYAVRDVNGEGVRDRELIAFVVNAVPMMLDEIDRLRALSSPPASGWQGGRATIHCVDQAPHAADHTCHPSRCAGRAS